MIKHSKQRDAIIERLSDRTDHPTAETLYQELKVELPNISLGTVYRNLNQLASLNKILIVRSPFGPDRYDPIPNQHPHFFCTNCFAVLDLDVDKNRLLATGQEDFKGEIQDCISSYYGLCPDCLEKLKLKH
jgi:Fur family peroxide stress response transcriptional regulator